MIWVIIIVGAVLLDQLTKYILISNLGLEQQIVVIDNFFNITHWTNSGAAWGIFQNGRVFFIPMTIVLTVILVRIMIKNDSRFLKLSIALTLGGAFGNFIDRVFRVSVVDFLQFFIGSYQFPVFNVADMFIVIGAGLLIFYMLFMHKTKDSESKEEIEKTVGNDNNG